MSEPDAAFAQSTYLLRLVAFSPGHKNPKWLWLPHWTAAPGPTRAPAENGQEVHILALQEVPLNRAKAALLLKV